MDSPDAEALDSTLDMSKEDEANLALIFTRLFLIFGGVLPYIPQYIQIMNTQDASGFSTFVCLIVICSNILRIAYWFGHWFDISLILQSIVMITVMLVVLELCLRTERNKTEGSGGTVQESYFLDFQITNFWNWTNLSSYLEACLAIFFLSTTYTTIFQDNEYLIEPIGFIALLMESALALPQFIKNYNNGSTEGMNLFMVVLWTIGDAVKGYFFFETGQPLPFQMCAIIQLIVDGALFYQVGAY